MVSLPFSLKQKKKEKDNKRKKWKKRRKTTGYVRHQPKAGIQPRAHGAWQEHGHLERIGMGMPAPVFQQKKKRGQEGVATNLEQMSAGMGMGMGIGEW